MYKSSKSQKLTINDLPNEILEIILRYTFQEQFNMSNAFDIYENALGYDCKNIVISINSCTARTIEDLYNDNAVKFMSVSKLWREVLLNIINKFIHFRYGNILSIDNVKITDFEYFKSHMLTFDIGFLSPIKLLHFVHEITKFIHFYINMYNKNNYQNTINNNTLHQNTINNNTLHQNTINNNTIHQNLPYITSINNIYDFMNISNITIQHISLYNFPRCFRYLKLTSIKMNFCNLINIDKKVICSQYLTNLDLGYNKIIRFYLDKRTSSNLNILNLSNNRLKCIGDIFKLKNLTSLNLSYNMRISNVDYLILNTKLEMLDLEHTGVIYLPSNINRMINLKKIVLDGTNIQFLPENLYFINTLEFLSISNCRYIFKLSDNVNKLVSLRILSIYCTNITIIPESITECLKLEFIMAHRECIQNYDYLVNNCIATIM